MMSKLLLDSEIEKLSCAVPEFLRDLAHLDVEWLENQLVEFS